MKRIHFISGLTLTIFIGFHLFNHFVSIFGIELHIALMQKLRLVYRNLVVETLLLTAVFIQIVSGIKLFFSKRSSITSYYEKLQIWTGLYLAFFLSIHVGAVLIGRDVFNLDTNFYFGAAGLTTFPLNLFFFPYYGLSIISFFGHISAIHYFKMKRKIFGLSVQEQSNLIFITGVIFALLILYGMTNGFKGVVLPEEFNSLIGK